jgi:opacity protein-like surface antigen
MKRLLAAAAIAATFAGVSAASAQPMGSYSHGQAYGASNWGAGYGQQSWRDRDLRGYAPAHGERYDRDRNYRTQYGRWDDQPSRSGYGVGYGVGGRQGYMGYSAGFALPNRQSYRSHW